MNEIRFIDLFGGIGGFHLGLEKAEKRIWEKDTKAIRKREKEGNDERDTGLATDRTGTQQCTNRIADRQFSCVWYCDKDKYATQTYNKNFKTDYKPTDITTVNTETIPEFDMLCAGFPCQSFSIAGKRKGFQDIRGTMFFEICRIAQAKKPRLLFLENVKGLLSADDGRCFGTILSYLDELGYDVEWQVLNSKNFGVPQNRERVFIIGHLRGNGGQQVFPLRESNEMDNEKSGSIEMIQNSGKEIARVYDTNGLAPTIKGKTGEWQEPKIIDVANARRDNGERGIREYTEFCPTLAQRDYKEPRCVMIECHTLQPRTDNPKQGGTGHLSRKDGYTYCLDSGNCQALEYPCLNPNDLRKGFSGQNKQTLKSSNMIRRLTPVECERLQGFPDNWTQGVSNTQRYKQLGNAVTVNVIEAIGERMLN